MPLPDHVLWTLNRLDAVQKSQGTCVPKPVDSAHLEALEDAGFITVRARDGGWLVYVLPEGQKAATVFRREQVQIYTQPKART